MYTIEDMKYIIGFTGGVIFAAFAYACGVRELAAALKLAFALVVWLAFLGRSIYNSWKDEPMRIYSYDKPPRDVTCKKNFLS